MSARAEWFSASSCADHAAHRCAEHCADAILAASSTAAASSAITGIEYGPGGTSLRPTPRLSYTIVR